jgi:hypothetical protein
MISSWLGPTPGKGENRDSRDGKQNSDGRESRLSRNDKNDSRADMNSPFEEYRNHGYEEDIRRHRSSHEQPRIYSQSSPREPITPTVSNSNAASQVQQQQQVQQNFSNFERRGVTNSVVQQFVSVWMNPATLSRYARIEVKAGDTGW